MSELKSCPFCGCIGTPRLKNENEIQGWEEIELKNPWFGVLCDTEDGGCGATGGYRETELEAIEAWNDREECDGQSKT